MQLFFVSWNLIDLLGDPVANETTLNKLKESFSIDFTETLLENRKISFKQKIPKSNLLRYVR